MAKRGPRRKKVACNDCFFQVNMLCALDRQEPCPTFRPNQPEGLKPPPQLSFVFRDRTPPRLHVFRAPNEADSDKLGYY